MKKYQYLHIILGAWLDFYFIIVLQKMTNYAKLKNVSTKKEISEGGIILFTAASQVAH